MAVFQANSIGPGNTPLVDPTNPLSVQSAAATQGTPPITPTINSSSITPTTPITIPPPPAVNTGSVANAGIPTPQSLITQDTPQTPAETAQQNIQNEIARITGGSSSLATLQAGQENTAGVSTLAKNVNDLNTQLQGLNDQSSLLSTNAMPGGAIENQEQQNAQGRGITTGGLAPLQAGDLRNNQIQQATIAARSLTVKSALYAANSNYTMAKAAADQAAQVAFDGQTQQLNYQKALLDAITPQLNKEEKNQATQLQADLADRQTQITQRQNDAKTGQALAIAAMQNNPQDPRAQFAAQQALQIPLTDPNYLQKVTTLVGQYQTNPLDTQLKQAQIADLKSKTKSNETGNQDPTVVTGWVTAIKNGTAKLSDITTNPSLKSAVAVALSQGGSTQGDILKTTQDSLKELQDMVDNNKGFTGAVGVKSFTGAGGPVGAMGQFFGMKTAPLAGTQAANFDFKLNQVKNDIILPNLNLLHGLGRVTDREFQALTSAVTALNTDMSQGAFKTELKTITDRITQKAQDINTSQSAQVQYQGKVYNVDAQGNMTLSQ